jgi:hypothetical protein
VLIMLAVLIFLCGSVTVTSAREESSTPIIEVTVVPCGSRRASAA